MDKLKLWAEFNKQPKAIIYLDTRANLQAILN